MWALSDGIIFGKGTMSEDFLSCQHMDYRQLQELVAGLAEGVILIGSDERIAWANQAALAMHGVGRVEDLGATVSEYRSQFALRCRHRHGLLPGQDLMGRILAGETSADILVDVLAAGGTARR